MPVCGTRHAGWFEAQDNDVLAESGLRSGRSKGKPFLQVGFLCIDESLTGAPVNDPDAFFLRISSRDI